MASPIRSIVPDKHILYQEAVQSPDVDACFLALQYKRRWGRPARLLREDFCGTGILSCEWVKLHRDNKALAIDIHAPTLRWGAKHILSRLSDGARARITQVCSDVLDVRRPAADIIAAMNFSYCVYKSRPQMLAYVRNARRSLNRGGMLILDAWGGSSTQTKNRDRTRLRGFSYYWEHDPVDPISGHISCRIHFQLADGTRLRNAFTYDWRLWTLPELQDLLNEAGFEDVHVLWEDTDRKNGKGSGRFRRAYKAPSEPGWVAYVIGHV